MLVMSMPGSPLLPQSLSVRLVFMLQPLLKPLLQAEDDAVVAARSRSNDSWIVE